MSWKDIEGYTNFETFYRLMAKTAKPDSIFVEVGSFKGKSAVLMAEELRKVHTCPRFYCVDNFVGIGEDNLDKLYNQFIINTKPYSHVIQLLRMSSVEAAKTFRDNSIDFVFIDAGHEYEEVMEDLNAWYPKVRDNGVIAGDDYGSGFPGVAKAVKTFFGRKYGLFSDPSKLDFQPIIQNDEMQSILNDFNIVKTWVHIK